MGKRDSVPDVRDGRPDFHRETERAGVPEDSVVGRRIPSLTVSETKEERVTTKNMSTDLGDPSGRTQPVRSWDDQAFATGYIDKCYGRSREQRRLASSWQNTQSMLETHMSFEPTTHHVA